MTAVCDAERGRRAAGLLRGAFLTDGIHGFKEMPESERPAGVEKGSLEHLMFITLTVAIDYQREAAALWESARSSFEDPATRYLFEAKALHERLWQAVREDMQKHGLAKKPGKDSSTWRTVGITFWKKWGGDPRNFLADCGWDAPTILERLECSRHWNNGREVLDFPYLRGKKIGPLWVRMLRDNVGLLIKNLREVPIPVDVHVARATLALGLVRGEYEGKLEEIYEKIRGVWRESVKGLETADREMIALDVDQPLWRLSKHGCTDRDPVTGECRHYEGCALREMCVPGRVRMTGGSVGLRT